MNAHYDAIIVGAGPAGCACAIVLNQAGLKVCLVDNRSTEIRFKEGESIPGATMRLLNRLGIAGIEELLTEDAFKPCVANLSAWGRPDWISMDSIVNPEGGGWHLNRVEFDKAICNKAIEFGIDFYQAKFENLNQVQFDNNSTVMYQIDILIQSGLAKKTLDCKWVIDASGRKSIVSKYFDVKKERLSSQMAAICWVKKEADDIDNTTRIKSTENGWWYTASLPGNQRVIAFFSLPGTIHQMVKQPEFFFEHCNESQLLPYTVSSSDAITRIKARDAGVIKLERAGSQGWIAVGDAVLSNDPLSSQGIFFALYSGVRGAEAIIANENADTITPNSPKNAALVKYQQQIDQVFQANQKARKYYYSCETRYSYYAFWRHSMMTS